MVQVNPENKSVFNRFINLLSGAGAPPQDSSEVFNFELKIFIISSLSIS